MARHNWEYIRVDVLISEHPKIERLSDRAFRALIDLWCYCGRQHSDGYVTDRKWKAIPSKVRAELLISGLAHPIDLGGGVEIHDYTGYQRSRKEIDEAASARSDKARHAANSRWGKDKPP